MSTHPITIIQLIAGILLALAPSAIALWFLWRGSAKKRHAVLAYRALEERCRTITTLAAETWPVLEPFRGVDYTTALGVIFRDAKALNTAVASMLDYPRPARNALDAKLLFDPIEAVKFAAAREGELQRVEECLAEMDRDHATSNFRTVTPANRVAEMVGWLRNRPGQNHPNGAAFGKKDPLAGNIQFLARQLHDIIRALEDAEYPTDNPAQVILQLLNTDRTVKPNVKLEERLAALNAQFRRTVDVCAPFAINVTFVEQVRANSYLEGGKAADERTLTEKRGRKTKVAETLIRAVGAGIITAEQAEQIGKLAKSGEHIGETLLRVSNMGVIELTQAEQIGALATDTIVTDGEAS